MKTNGYARLQTIRAMALLLTGLGAVLSAAAGTNYAWTITAPNAVDDWTNSANWKPAGIPGSTTGDSAYLTNAVGNAYSSILNVSPANTLSTLLLSNRLGSAWLVVTQGVAATTCTVTSLTIANGGGLEIDNGGTVSNVPTFNWLGTSGQMVLNTGGGFFTTNAIVLGSFNTNVTALVSSASGPGGVWFFGANTLKTQATNTIFAVQGVALTNLGGVTVGNGPGALSNTLSVTAGGVVSCGSVNIGQGSAFCNILAITNGGRLYGGGASVIGNGGAASNTVVVAGTKSLWTTMGSQLNVGGNSAAAVGNSLTISNSAQVISGGTAAGTYIGYAGANNAALVTGAGSIWNLSSNGLTIGGGAGQGNNTLSVDSGGVVTNVNVLTIGATAGYGNSLIVRNGSQVWAINVNIPGAFNTAMVSNASQLSTLGNDNTIGSVAGASNNTVTIAGANSVWDMTGRALTLGSLSSGNSVIVSNGAHVLGGRAQEHRIGSGGSNNTVLVTGSGSLWDFAANPLTIGRNAANGNVLCVDQGAVVTNVNIVCVGTGGGSGNSLILTNGGQFWVTTGLNFKIGQDGVSNAVAVSGTGSLLAGIPGETLSVGFNTATGDTMRVDNGGCVSNWGNLYVGAGNSAYLCAGNTLVITNGGQVVAIPTVTVCSAGSNSFNNSIQVAAGGLLETSALSVNTSVKGPVSGNCITNAGGIYQFPTATPTITLLSNGMVYITSGTIAFRGVTNADIRNATLLATNKMTWNGNNAFRLNNATNRNDASQNYVFDTGSATNYYRLEMVNGNTRYRGLATNSLTIGANGQMLCSNTAATVELAYTNNGTLTLVNSTLTFATNAVLNGTVVVDLNNLSSSGPVLAAQGNLTLGSSILQFVGSPSSNLTLMSYAGTRNGKFQVTGLPATYAVAYGAGANDAISLHAVPPSTVILFR